MIQLEGEWEEWHQDLGQGWGFAISNGSFKTGQGTAAWIIKGWSLAHRLIGRMITPGHQEDHSAFHSKLCSLLSILITLAHIPPASNWPKCQVACDGKLALYQIQHSQPVDPKEPHADLISACQACIQQCPYNLEWHHVKGHQDNHMTMVLAQDTWLDIEVNQLARQYLLNNELFLGPTQYIIPGSQWCCLINRVWVVKQLQEHFREHINGPVAIQYWQAKCQMSPQIWAFIDWDALSNAYKEISISKQRWASKWTLGHFTHGKNMARCKFHSSAVCPQCGATQEDKAHVLSCSDPLAMQVWKTSHQHLKEWLKTQTTYQPISEAILHRLVQWCNPSTQPLNPRTAGWTDQDQIGWSRMLDGWVAWSWESQQGQMWLVSKLCKSSKWWTIELIKKLLNMAWDMWEHCNGTLHHSPNAQQQIVESLVSNAIREKYA